MQLFRLSLCHCRKKHIRILSVTSRIKIHFTGGGPLARPGAFKSEKRKKELMRQKKQEKKRQRRLGKEGATGDASTEEAPAEEAPAEEQDKPLGLEEEGQ